MFKKFYCVLFLIFLMASLVRAEDASPVQSKLMMPNKAVSFTEVTPEAKAFYDLEHGRFMRCIEKKVVKPCDSHYVTCIEDAWVVEYTLSETCGIKHDERFGLYFVVDGITGKIISRYPEVEYFKQPNFCHEDYECSPVKEENGSFQCLNFIFAQLRTGEAKKDLEQCLCQKNSCEDKKNVNDKTSLNKEEK